MPSSRAVSRVQADVCQSQKLLRRDHWRVAKTCSFIRVYAGLEMHDRQPLSPHKPEPTAQRKSGNRILLASVSGSSKGRGCIQSRFILIGQGVFRTAEPCTAG